MRPPPCDTLRVLSELVFPRAPHASVRVVREVGRSEGFLSMRRVDLSVEDGPAFAYDVVERRAMDAAVIAAHYQASGKPWVVLVSCVRPPFALRGEAATFLELPAGLIEPGEEPAEAALRELFEETGLVVSQVSALGPPVLPAPAMIAERQHMFHVSVTAEAVASTRPRGDGSDLERRAVLAPVPLEDALRMAKLGLLADSKSELALRRLAEALA